MMRSDDARRAWGRAWGVPAAALLLAVALAACGSDEAASSDEGADDELTKVTLGVGGSAGNGALWVGLNEGIFEEHGLELELQPVTDSTQMIPNVAANKIQFGYGAVFNSMTAVEKGLPLMVAAPANVGPSSADEPDTAQIISLADSGIESPKDLEGKSVALINLAGFTELLLKEAVSADGGDPEKVEMVAVPQDQMTGALTRNQVDAILNYEPFNTQLRSQADVTTIANALWAAGPGTPNAAWITSKKFAESDADTVAAFQEAMAEANAFANDNADAVREAIAENTETPPELLDEMILPIYAPQFGDGAIERLAEQTLEYGYIESIPDLETWVVAQPS